MTAKVLSSKTNVKGGMVARSTAADVVVFGHIVIPKGTAATGQITEAQAKGAMGMSGRLAIAPSIYVSATIIPVWAERHQTRDRSRLVQLLT